MTNRQRKRTTLVEVKAVFEPSRVAQACLAEAYERVIPTARRPSHTDRASRANRTVMPRRAGGGRR